MNIGILLTNLGTPDAPTSRAVRRYLAEFLSDRRVVEIPSFLWWPILHGIILRTRPKRVAHLYQNIWTDLGSPLLVQLKAQAEALQNYFATDGANQTANHITVSYGMRYGNPSLNQALENLQTMDRIIVLPLYPQYAAATTGSTFDAISQILQSWRTIPELCFIRDYHDFAPYVTALAQHIKLDAAHLLTDHLLLLSYHGLPQASIAKGDPYYQQCLTTSQLLISQLQLQATQYQVVFQSRFGRAAWLQPYCDMTLKALPQQGITKVAVVCPGFSSDCLETLEEMNIQNRTVFLKAGGESFHYIPALNQQPAHIEALALRVMPYFRT